MKTTMILETLAAALFATAQVHAAPISLDNAVISATYQGSANGIAGLDNNFAGGPGGNVSHLDPTNSGVEFISADGLFAFDFSNTGLLTVYDNNPIPALLPGDPGYTFTFDFGATLPAAIGKFTLVDGSSINGVPGLTVLNGHAIGLDLSQVTWNDTFVTFSAQIGVADAAAVPEPASLALVLAGACGLAANRKRKRA